MATFKGIEEMFSLPRLPRKKPRGPSAKMLRVIEIAKREGIHVEQGWNSRTWDVWTGDGGEVEECGSLQEVIDAVADLIRRKGGGS